MDEKEFETKKILPDKLGGEVFLQNVYAICRFMESKKAYKTKQNQPMILTLKPTITSRELGPQIQLHLRFHGRDEWFKEEDTIDVDAYVPVEEWRRQISELWANSPVLRRIDRVHYLSSEAWNMLDDLLGQHGFGGYYDLLECLKMVLSRVGRDRLREGWQQEVKDLPTVVSALLEFTKDGC